MAMPDLRLEIASRIKNHVRTSQLRRIYRRYETLTMIPENVYVDNLRLAEVVQNVAGCVVECGTWRGGMMAGLADVLGPSRAYFLFDSFEGLPPAAEVDGPAALSWQANVQGPHYYNNCTASEEEARNAMRASRAREYTLVRGWFKDTIPRFQPPDPIALLRLDGDWYDSTRICLTNLYPYLAPSGVIIVDDYEMWDGCARAVHEWLLDHPALRLKHFNGQVCFIRKPADEPAGRRTVTRRE